VSGFPASDFTAIPVDSGFSDYYGGSVALGNIQEHFSHSVHSPGQLCWHSAFPFRQSPFRDYAMSFLCCRMGLTPFSTILWFRSVPSIVREYEIKISTPEHPQVYLQVCGELRYARPPAIHKAILLSSSYIKFCPCASVKYVKLIPYSRHAADIFSPNSTCYTPQSVSLLDKSRDNRLRSMG
jgi:hypothetical protein